jgi:hypothetical protein
MTDDAQNKRIERTNVAKTGNSSVGMVIATVILVVGIIAAIWYFQSSGGSNENTDFTILIDPNSDPGVATTIFP